MSSVASNHRNTFWLATVLVAILVLRIVSLWFNRTDLFFDEAQYWAWSTEPAFGYFSKPPMLAWIIGAFTTACGSDSTFCIRLAAPVLHFFTALAIFAAARAIFDWKTGTWSAIVFATLPAVSLSSTLISTDVPLLLCWALALWALWRLLETGWFSWAIMLGLAFGAGLMSKYAMAYFAGCTLVFLAISPAARTAPVWRGLLAALAIGLVMLAPNLYWNQQNGFATIAHTVDNANWQQDLFHPLKASEFILGQLGVFGPVLFFFLLAIAWWAFRQGADLGTRYLLAFSLPIIAVITMQAFLSRANANWGATAYVAATILVTYTVLQAKWKRWFFTSLAIHGVLLLGLCVAVVLVTPGRFGLPANIDPFTRVMGWRSIGAETSRLLEMKSYAGVLAPDRALSSELIYYLRKRPEQVLAWREGDVPTDHFQMTRPYREDFSGPLLLVSRAMVRNDIRAAFTNIERVGTLTQPGGAVREIWFYRISKSRVATD